MIETVSSAVSRETVLRQEGKQDGKARREDFPCPVVLRLSHNSFTRGFETRDSENQSMTKRDKLARSVATATRWNEIAGRA